MRNNYYLVTWGNSNLRKSHFELNSEYIGIFRNTPIYLNDLDVIDSNIYVCSRNIRKGYDNTHPSLIGLENNKLDEMKTKIITENTKNLNTMRKIFCNIYSSSN